MSAHPSNRSRPMPFTELSALSNFTFLTGAAHPEEYIERAATLGLSGVAIADENSVAGIVRAHARAHEIARQVRERQRQEVRDGMIGPPAPWPTIPDWSVTPRLIPAARLVLRRADAHRSAPRPAGLGQPVPPAHTRAAARGQRGLRSAPRGSAGGGGGPAPAAASRRGKGLARAGTPTLRSVRRSHAPAAAPAL